MIGSDRHPTKKITGKQPDDKKHLYNRRRFAQNSRTYFQMPFYKIDNKGTNNNDKLFKKHKQHKPQWNRKKRRLHEGKCRKRANKQNFVSNRIEARP